MEGNHPNYQQVVPKESGKRIVVNRGLLESALRRCRCCRRDKANAVKLSFAPGGMTLFSVIRIMGGDGGIGGALRG